MKTPIIKRAGSFGGECICQDFIIIRRGVQPPFLNAGSLTIYLLNHHTYVAIIIIFLLVSPREPANPTSRSHIVPPLITTPFTLNFEPPSPLSCPAISLQSSHIMPDVSPPHPSRGTCLQTPLPGNPTPLTRLTKRYFPGQAHCQVYNRATSHVSSIIPHLPSLLLPHLSYFALNFVNCSC